MPSLHSPTVHIAQKQAKKLKSQPDTPQGRRDALLMCLLLDHGLRVGEVARLQVSDFDLWRISRPTRCPSHVHFFSAPGSAAVVHAFGMPSRRHGSLIVSSPRNPSITIRIFSSAEYWQRVLRLMSRMVASAEPFFAMISTPLGPLFGVESLPYSNPLICPSNSGTKEVANTAGCVTSFIFSYNY
jgi:hypothetical protein